MRYRELFPAMTLNGPFRPYFSLCSTHANMAGWGPRNSSPRAGDSRVFLLSQGCPAVLAPQAERREPQPLKSEEFSEIINSAPAQDTVPGRPHSVTANLYLPSKTYSIRHCTGYSASHSTLAVEQELQPHLPTTLRAFSVVDGSRPTPQPLPAILCWRG